MCMSAQYTATSPLRIGTRGSPLALWQAEDVRDRLIAAHGLPMDAVEIRVISTSGDKIQDRPLSEVGGKGLFTKEIEHALINKDIDVAVHSTKDVATVLPPGLTIRTFLPREDVRDAFISLTYPNLDALPLGAVVGTSSIRRRAQVLAKRPDLKLVEFRGNVQTRLQKLHDGVAVATFLALAGLNRLGIADTGTPIGIEHMLPAPAQGAVCVEQRADDESATELLAAIHHDATAACVRVERAFLAGLDGDCRSPIAAYAQIVGGDIHLRGEILSLDGQRRLSGDWQFVEPAAEAQAKQVAIEMKSAFATGDGHA